MNYLAGRRPRSLPLATLFRRPMKGLRQKLHRAVARRHDDQKGGRDLAPSRCGRAAGGEGRSAADYAVFYSPIVAESDQWSVPRVVQQHERDTTIVQIANPKFKSVRGTRFAVRDGKDARCR